MFSLAERPVMGSFFRVARRGSGRCVFILGLRTATGRRSSGFRLAQLPAQIQSRREREYAESGPEGRTNQDLEEKSYCSGTAGAYLDSALSQNKARHNLVFLAGSASQWFLRNSPTAGSNAFLFFGRSPSGFVFSSGQAAAWRRCVLRGETAARRR